MGVERGPSPSFSCLALPDFLCYEARNRPQIGRPLMRIGGRKLRPEGNILFRQRYGRLVSRAGGRNVICEKGRDRHNRRGQQSSKGT